MAEIPQFENLTSRAVAEGRLRARRSFESLGLTPGNLGNECSRRLWYEFRWAHAPEVIDARKDRLFETGDVEEGRIIADLRRGGIDILDRGEDGRQIRVRLVGGHLRGKIDGQAHGVPEAPKTDHLLECKSHNEKSFRALVKTGVQASKPLHYAQMQVYMHGVGLTRALYAAVNKNDDDLYFERVDYDAAAALALLAKAERIALSDDAPAKLHEDPDAKMAFACRSCPALGVCHQRAFARRNCRTCIHASVRLDGDGRWACARYGHDLTVENQRAGCPSHLYLPDLVPGEQVDADEEAETVTYLVAGVEWRDGLREAA